MVTSSSNRRGFTLIELMVAIALILTLAAIVIVFFPRLDEQARAGRGAQQLQSWLNIAKQRALRDQGPRGLRLLRNKNNPNLVTDCFFIEQPDDFTGGTVFTVADGQFDVLVKNGPDLYNNNPLDPTLWEVQPGDYLEINGGGLLRRITNITSSFSFQVDANTPITYKLEETATWRILRAPRILGDEKFTMPTSTAIDVKTNVDYGNPLPPGPVPQIATDILFAPSGQVMTPGITTGTLNLWVRDTADALNTDPTFGEPVIIAVFVRSGMVKPFSVAKPPASPYVLIR